MRCSPHDQATHRQLRCAGPMVPYPPAQFIDNMIRDQDDMPITMRVPPHDQWNCYGTRTVTISLPNICRKLTSMRLLSSKPSMVSPLLLAK
jgi:hypothetical protein